MKLKCLYSKEIKKITSRVPVYELYLNPLLISALPIHEEGYAYRVDLREIKL